MVGKRPAGVLRSAWRAHFDGRWKPLELPEQPVEALVHANRLLAVEPDASTVGARWEREQDIPDRVYFRALEAL